MTDKKIVKKKFAGRKEILFGYRETTVQIGGPDADRITIRYRSPSARAMLKMSELAKAAKGDDVSSEEAELSWKRVTEMLAAHLVDEAGKPLCEAEELMDAPLDTVMSLVEAIVPSQRDTKTDEVATQGEG